MATYVSESYRLRDSAGETGGEKPSYAEAKSVELEQRITAMAAKLPAREAAALLQVASASRSELAGADEALDRLLGQRDIFHIFRREVEDGLKAAQSSPHAALIFSSGPNTIRPVEPAISQRQFTEHAHASLRAHGISASDMPDSGLLDRAYTAGKVQALGEVRRRAEQVLAGLEAGLNDPRLVAQARRQILDRLTEAYANRIEKKLGQIDKHIGRISGLGRMALRRHDRTNSELADIGMLTSELTGISMLGNMGFELDFYSAGRNWLEVAKLIPTGPQVVQQLKAIANAYPGSLQSALQGTIDAWVAQAKNATSGNNVGEPRGEDAASDVALLRKQGLTDMQIYKRLSGFSDPEGKNGYLKGVNVILRSKARTPTERGGRDRRYQ